MCADILILSPWNTFRNDQDWAAARAGAVYPITF
ncbi:hypothetical protein [Sporisorium scitamineum]|uniref:Uncharacterized protein n=1 Tax=Sporisorium scitamineum TaxID=49012 RepID=A0A0F7RW80_9BASI|nr:hypothetical protein [Sporisorium scitamineum]